MEKHKRRHRSTESAKEPERSIFSRLIFFLLCAMPVLSAIAYGAVDIWATSLLAVFSAALVVLWIKDAWREKEFRFSSSSLQLPILGLILIGFVQLLPIGNAGVAPDLLSIPAVSSISQDPYATRFFLIRLVILFLFFSAALTYIDSHGRIRKTVLMVIIFGAAMAFFGILQRLASPEAIIYGLRPTPHAIPFSSFVNQHHFAAFMEMTAGLTLGLLLGGAVKKDKNSLLGIAVVLMGIAVILTGSRGGLLSFLGMIGFVLAARTFTKNEESVELESPTSKLALIAGGAALILIAAGTVLYLGGGDQLLRGVGLQGNQADVTNGRIHFWYIAVQIFFANPILGAGFDAFAVAFSRYDTWNGVFRVEQAHNDYLQTLADAGVLGLACIAAFIFLLFKRSLTFINEESEQFRKSTMMGALAGCFGILIHSFFDFPIRTPSNAFFFLLLVVLATVSVGQSKKEKI